MFIIHFLSKIVRYAFFLLETAHIRNNEYLNLSLKISVAVYKYKIQDGVKHTIKTSFLFKTVC